MTKIEEPEQAPVEVSLIKGAMSHRHFALGALAIFLYMGIEVGVPNFVQQYLSADNQNVLDRKIAIAKDFESNKIDIESAAVSFVGTTNDIEGIRAKNDSVEVAKLNKDIKKTTEKFQNKEITSEKLSKTFAGLGIPAGTVGMIVAVYWFMMLIGRFVGASIGGKVSSRSMITTVSIATLVLVLFGMFAPDSIADVPFPGVDWGNLTIVWQDVPVGIFAFLLVGLCTSVMWGGIFNMAVEGLGKYTAIASGIFMTMVFGCAVMMFIQASVADAVGYIQSYWVVVFCAAYLLFYALVGSRVHKRAE